MSNPIIKVLAICPFPADFPSTRYRLLQYVEPLRGFGIEIEYRPFLDPEGSRRYFEDPRLFSRLSTIAHPVVRRLQDILRSTRVDVVFIQREAIPFGPDLFESMVRIVGTPIVLDVDDAVYLPYNAGRYGRLGSLLKFHGKLDRLIRSAHAVVCGGEFLSDYVKRRGGRPVVIPTIVDKNIFKPSRGLSDPPVIGWIGTPSSYPYLKAIFPALSRLAEKHRFTLRLRGTGEKQIDIENVSVENLEWSAETEVEDFRSLDIGLYPLVESEHQPLEFIQGKSGLKAIQYLALGIPYVVSPIGVTRSIGVPGSTHFEARNTDEWFRRLDLLLTDVQLRRVMGERGRAHFLANYDLDHWTAELAKVLIQAARKGEG